MLYADLTQEQKDILRAWDTTARGWFNTLATMLNQAQSLQAALDASNGPRDIVALLDAGQEIPNNASFFGAHDMTKEEWSSLITLLDSFITANGAAASRQLYAKAAGPRVGI